MGRNGTMKLLALLFLAIPSPTRADQYGDFTYSTNGTNITITGYTGPGGAVTIPNWILVGGVNLSVTSIGNNAFVNHPTLTSVAIGTNVISIGNYAFSNCHNLISVTIPNSVTSIGDEAFAGCGLTNVTIPNSVISIGHDTFMECLSLTAIMVDTNNPAYSTLTGVLFNKSQTILIQYPGGRAGNYTIPDGVTNIGDHAFFYCLSLTDIIIPNSVIGIGQNAFNVCSGLTNVTIGKSVTSIGATAFAECTSLGQVIIPGSVTNIGASAFDNCHGLTSVTIPNSVTSIGLEAFNSCISLTNVIIPDSVINIGGEAFNNCASLTAVTVNELNSFYSSADGVLFNKSQTTLIQYPCGKEGSNYTVSGSVTNIMDMAFAYCASLTGVYFQGNAPNLAGSNVFYSDNATLYYLPGTTGWGTTFGGLPTAPWLLANPTILSFEPDFGVQTNGFSFTISWATNVSIAVEACTNLGGTWIPLQSVSLTNGFFYFSDPDWINYRSRFYRIRSP